MVVFLIGMSQRSSYLLRFPRKMTSLFFITAMCFLEKITLQSSSHSGPIAMRDALFRWGSIKPCCACGESFDDNGICPVPVVWRGVASGCCTGGPGVIFTLCSMQASSERM